MKRRINYTDESIELKVIKDFLPSPEYLVAKGKNVKVTITLTKHSIDFLKKYAKSKHSHYQTMIRKIIDYYVNHYAA